MKNLLPIVLGIAFVTSVIAYLHADKSNQQLAEQLRQAEERAQIAEAEMARLRETLQRLGSAAAPSPAATVPGQTAPTSPPSPIPPGDTAAAEPKSPGTESPPSELLAKEVSEHAAQIKTRVERAWRIPPGVPDTAECIVKIELSANGQLENVGMVQSSGNTRFDDSAVAAVKRASPFPMPISTEAAARFRSFNFRFKPGG